MADLWLAPRIGTDAALGLAFAHVLISEDLYDKAFVERSCHGFAQLAARAAVVALVGGSLAWIVIRRTVKGRRFA